MGTGNGVSGLWQRITALSLEGRKGRQRAGWDADRADRAEGAGGGGEVRTLLPGCLTVGEIHLNTFP